MKLPPTFSVFQELMKTTYVPTSFFANELIKLILTVSSKQTSIPQLYLRLLPLIHPIPSCCHRVLYLFLERPWSTDFPSYFVLRLFERCGFFFFRCGNDDFSNRKRPWFFFQRLYIYIYIYITIFYSCWWLISAQPNWKIWAKLDHFPSRWAIT